MPRLNLPGWGVNRSWDLYYFLGLPVARSLLGSWHGLPGVPEHLSLEVTSPNLSWPFQKYTALHDRWLATVDYHRWHTNCSAGFIEPSWPMPLRRSAWLKYFPGCLLAMTTEGRGRVAACKCVETKQVFPHRWCKNWPPLWSWLAATARTPAPFMDPADRRWYTLQHSCWMVYKARRRGHSGLTQRTSAVYAIWWWWWWSTCTIFSILWMIDSAWMHSINRQMPSF